jgi:phosphopentomutase
MAEKSVGKDTTTGHWEMSGIVISRRFPTYPDGFPGEFIHSFESAIGRRTLGNYPASGTEIIKELGSEHLRTGYPIVYTSADSVFQIACHEDIVPVEQLYEWCETARRMFVEPNDALRVIARPFTGRPGSFTRTEKRKDFSLPPIDRTILDAVHDASGNVIAIGKIGDIFAERGINESIHTTNNEDGIRSTIEMVRSGKGNLVFVNLVDFDMIYGHRNDSAGYARALKEFDAHIPELIDAMRSDDVLMISADHGCDPTTPGTDHTREYVPIIAYRHHIAGKDLGLRRSFCDVAATIADLLHVQGFSCGESFAGHL